MMVAKKAAKMFSPHDKKTADIDDDDIDIQIWTDKDDDGK